MNQFASDLRNDICLQEVENIEECIQILYIISGCDYISYFKGFGKKTFFDVFRKKHVCYFHYRYPEFRYQILHIYLM